MSVAAHYRGSVAQACALERQYPRKSPDGEILDALNTMHGEVTLFAATIVRLGGHKKNNSEGWYVLNRPGDWREYAISPFRSLAHVAKRYDVYFLDLKRDALGQYAVIVPKREWDNSTEAQRNLWKTL